MLRQWTMIRAGFLGIALLTWCGVPLAATRYHSPLAVATAPDGNRLYVSDPTAGCVVVVDAAAGAATGQIAGLDDPRGLAMSSDGKTLYVAERKAHAIAVIDTEKAAITRRFQVGPWPNDVTIAPKQDRLYTCNRGDHTVSIVDVATGNELKRLKVVREPDSAELTPDGSRLIVTNLLPDGPGTDSTLGAELSILDTVAMEPKARIKLPAGSTVVRGVCVSPDGKWAYVVFTLGRFNLPITQLDRGWVHTYALGIVDLASNSLFATLVLDDMTGGSADPWSVAVSPDGKRLWVTHSGTHELSILEIGRVHELLEGKVPEELSRLKDGMRDNVWVRIGQDRKLIPKLANDLTALYLAGAIRRVPSGGIGPRGLTLSPAADRLYVANYFSGTIGVLDAATGKLAKTIALGPQPPADAARRGEIYFHDAMRCFQRWHSCASCHPDARVDGLPWDFMRDGIGNGKDVISLVNMQHTSPHNRRATRADPRECIRTGVTGSHLIVPEPADVEDMLAYVQTLQPERNPSPPPAEAVVRGKTLFEGKADCVRCHPAPYFTDGKMHNVGIHTSNEPDGKYDTPSLVECYRTAPYYHDGRAATLRDAFSERVSSGGHGKAEILTPQELDDLIAYVLSL